MNKLFVAIVIGFVCLAPTGFCLADTAAAPATAGGAADNKASEVKLVNPLGGTDQNPIGKVYTVPALIGTVIKAVLGVIGAITLLIFFNGASSWLFSAGNQEMVKKGTNTMLYAALGVSLVFLSYIVMSYVLRVASGGQ